MIIKKYNLFIYPFAKSHVHDDEKLHLVNGVSQYLNTVPFSKKGISEHFNITTADKADFFYMGQISDGMEIPKKENFVFLEGNESKHICDIEGDWVNRFIPEWMKNCILTINGAKKEYSDLDMFIRPTFSFLLVDLAKKRNKFIRTKEINTNFGFRGFPDPYGVRKKMKESFDKSGFDGEVILNNTWQAQNNINSENTVKYIKTLTDNTFSLCPMGAGVDSIRFYETCYFGSIPIIISNNIVPFEYEFDKPFYFRVDPSLSVDGMLNEFIKIKNTDLNTLKEMSKNSQEYFETQIRLYFIDPTLKFLKWYNNE
jgi:hypothetical protein